MFEIIEGVVFDFPLAYFLVMVSVLLFNVVTVTLAAATAFKVDGDAQTDELADYRTAEFVFRLDCKGTHVYEILFCHMKTLKLQLLGPPDGDQENGGKLQA